MAETPRASVTHTAAINMRWLCIKNDKTDQIANSLLLESEIMWQCFLKHCVQYKYNMSRKNILVPSIFTLSFQMGCLMPLCHEETLCWVLVGDLRLPRGHEALSLSLSLSLSLQTETLSFPRQALPPWVRFPSFSLSHSLSLSKHTVTHTLSVNNRFRPKTIWIPVDFNYLSNQTSTAVCYVGGLWWI